jgi:hypothetical protein
VSNLEESHQLVLACVDEVEGSLVLTLGGLRYEEEVFGAGELEQY